MQTQEIATCKRCGQTIADNEACIMDWSGIALEHIDCSPVILNNEPDGAGIPYFGQPNGVYEHSPEAEDEMEQARR